MLFIGVLPQFQLREMMNCSMKFSLTNPAGDAELDLIFEWREEEKKCFCVVKIKNSVIDDFGDKPSSLIALVYI